jgi:hypothetical protein
MMVAFSREMAVLFLQLSENTLFGPHQAQIQQLAINKYMEQEHLYVLK